MLPRLSVIVVSRHRPEALRLCLLALRQQIGVQPEVIVVADHASLAALDATDVKAVAFEAPNISTARNLGLAQAACDVVAFIDDDAVAEPTWAGRLLAAFALPDVVAATGDVRGRNGLSYQWRAAEVDALGQDHPLSLPEEGIHLPPVGLDRAIKTPGTNCAFRTQALRQIGGFDPGFRFYLDETDVNLRLVAMGRSAIVPLAQVVHGFLPSERRRADRVPLRLFDIGASTALFLRRHAPDRLAQGQAMMEGDQRRRLLRHMLAGRIEPRDVRHLLADLRAGWAEGAARPHSVLAPLDSAPPPFLPLCLQASSRGQVVAGWVWNRSTVLARAAAARAKGQVVTVVLLSPGWRRHVLRFAAPGIWLQEGGLWGRAERSDPPPLRVRFARRVAMIAARAARLRPVE